MPPDLLRRPTAAVAPPPVDDAGEDADCIFCRCRPVVSYCGVYDDGPGVPLTIDDDTCKDCYELWSTTGCPGCGCVRDGICGKCAPPRSPWWIRMWS